MLFGQQLFFLLLEAAARLDGALAVGLAFSDFAHGAFNGGVAPVENLFSLPLGFGEYFAAL